MNSTEAGNGGGSRSQRACKVVTGQGVFEALRGQEQLAGVGLRAGRGEARGEERCEGVGWPWQEGVFSSISLYKELNQINTDENSVFLGSF